MLNFVKLRAFFRVTAQSLYHMTILAVGINHKTASVALREKVAFSPENLTQGLCDIVALSGCLESSILSTCNRTELYCAIDDNFDIQQLGHWLAEFHGVDYEELATSLYLHHAGEGVEHLMEVACGLDSMVLGEPQILGQAKQAYNQAKQAGTLGPVLERLYQAAFNVAKVVRTETEIGASAVSVAFAGVNLAKHIFGDLDKARILLIGAGETVDLVGKHLQENGAQHIVVANRTLKRAQDLADTLGGEAIPLGQIPQYLPQSDIVVSSTASTLPIIGKGIVETALKQRKHQPILFIDLAVPRDIEAQVDELEDVFLYTVDDLQEIVAKNLDNRKKAAEKATGLVKTHAIEFASWLRAQASVDHIRDFRQQAEDVRQKLTDKAVAQLAAGQPADKVLLELSHKLTNGLIHHPTTALNKAARAGDLEQLMLLSEVLGLKVSASLKE